MTAIDWVLVAFTAVLAFYGYSQGFIVGALSLAGFVIGALVGTRFAPLLLSRGDRSPYAPLFGLGGALLAGGALASGMEGIGARLRAVMRIPGLRLIDGLLGAALTACVALGIAWIVGAVALDAPVSPALRADIRGSRILRTLDELLPPSGPILNALARFDPLPSVTGPVPNLPPPRRAILRAGGVRAAAAAVVRVTGTACGLGVEGSGWVAAPGIVVTNAHVVAGERDTVVQVHGAGPALRAAPLVFDVHNDIAILRVAALAAPALRMAAQARIGEQVAILGYPLDGPFDAQPGRVGRTVHVVTENAYGQGHVLRSITALRGLVRPGNSGGPLVDAHGRVVATVFAALTDTAHAGGFAVPDAVVARDLRRALSAGGTVSTGACAG
ncbi:MAG TPA: MarP family serine protease [Solirubrobacteraceae bacterium]|nr:MarP family serine protease [Solirubrobacteraceae bacterium]